MATQTSLDFAVLFSYNHTTVASLMPRVVRIVYAVGIYALALAVPFLLENASELAEYLPQTLKQGLEGIGAAYQRWSNGPRARESRYTAVVTLNQNDFPVLREACKQRALVTKLLPLLVQAGASEVVLDLAFTRSLCPETENEHATDELKAALAKAATEVPVVIGQASWALGELSDEEKIARLRAGGFEKDSLLLKPLIDLPLQDSQHQLSTGLIRVNQDPRKIPLSWTVYEEHGDALSRITSSKTLSFVAALAYRAPFPDGTAELEALEKRESRHPLTSFLPRKRFIQVRAADLMCKDPVSNALQACSAGPPVSVKRLLNGKTVLLGWEDNPQDVFATPAGNLPGVFIQANFVESLLDSRWLRVIPTGWQLGLSVLWFGLIELPFRIYKKSLQKALAGAILVFVVGAFLFYYVAVVNLGFYLALLPPSFVAILLRCWYQWSESRKEPITI